MRQTLTIPVEPVPKARPRLGARGNIYTPKESRDYENLVAWYGKTIEPMQGTVSLKVTFFCNPRRKLSDLDNLIKSLLDGLEKGGVIQNDVQVGEIHAVRLLDPVPRVELTLETPLRDAAS